MIYRRVPILSVGNGSGLRACIHLPGPISIGSARGHRGVAGGGVE